MYILEEKRWDGSKKESITIKCPEILRNYNKSMGGVDLCNMLISLYHTNIKTKRWYIKILFHCIDILKVNAWNLYRPHCIQLRTLKKSQLTLLQISIGIDEGLTRAGHPIRITWRPSKHQSNEPTPPTKRKKSISMPVSDICYDGAHHWLEFWEKKLNFHLCKTGNSQVYCKDCNICICLSNTRNCFYDFHITSSW